MIQLSFVAVHVMSKKESDIIYILYIYERAMIITAEYFYMSFI